MAGTQVGPAGLWLHLIGSSARVAAVLSLDWWLARGRRQLFCG